jgi:hypothetical protein
MKPITTTALLVLAVVILLAWYAHKIYEQHQCDFEIDFNGNKVCVKAKEQ